MDMRVCLCLCACVCVYVYDSFICWKRDPFELSRDCQGARVARHRPTASTSPTRRSNILRHTMARATLPSRIVTLLRR